MEFRSFCGNTSSKVENELKPIELLTADAEIELQYYILIIILGN